MNQKSIITIIFIGVIVIAFLLFSGVIHFDTMLSDDLISTDELQDRPVKKRKNPAPSDWFVRQRAYPETAINTNAYRAAIAQAKRMRAAYPQTDEAIWEEAGPSNIGGRVTALGIHPTTPDIVFAGSADGGVLKSTDGGVTWSHVFDETEALAIGAIAVDPSDPNTIWVGTGESNASGDSYPGSGIYRSVNSGVDWEHKGLDNSFYIGRIVIDPTNPQRIFTAACGALFDTNPDRGIYRTENGGSSWEQVLYLTDSTAAIDVALNPQNPQVVYAAMWERIRRPEDRIVGGETSGIWRSLNGGNDWQELSNGLPSGPEVGRIGITISPSDPDVLYALYANHPGYLMGVWKTTNGGDSWTDVNSPSTSIYSSYGWYFGNIYVDPVDPDEVYALGVYLYRSTNGGGSWYEIGSSIHVDHHAFWINPDNPNRFYDGNDAGVNYSTNGGTYWTKSYNLHISQFYAIEIDNLNSYRLYGGTQDTGTLRTWTGALNDWEMILGGDGFYTVVDFTNSNTIFAEYQWGGLRKSTNGGSSFYSCLSGVSSSDRRNWSTPVVMDPTDHNVLYYGTYRLYQTINLATDWDAISGDLTNGPPTGNLTYGTITTIAVAPTNSDVIYVGTDDGNAWVTQNGGNSWNSINQDLPDRWITRVAVSPQDESTAYVTLSGYKINEYLPHVFRTMDYGVNWLDISGNLPEVPINAIVEDPENPQRLVIGTDLGVYYTENLGDFWQPLGTEIPICGVHDLKLHNPTRTLVAGTHGRSMYKMNLDSLTVGPNVSVSLTPESGSIQLPATGGNFDFNIAATNGESYPMTTDVWTDITLPNGSVFGPVIGPVEATIGGGVSIERDRTQAVPSNAPVGEYRYNAYIGDYPEIWDTDSFTFTKLAEGQGPIVNEWASSGEPFEGEDITTSTGLSSDFTLLEAFPNPFNPTTAISFQLSVFSYVNVTVYDIQGRQVAELVNGWRNAGYHEVTFDASNLASGIYFYRIEAGEFTATGKMVLMK